MGSRGLCLGGHGDGAAAGYRVWHGAQGGLGPGLSQLPHSGAPWGAPTQHGSAPREQHWEVGAVGSQSPGVAPSAHPRSCAPAPHSPEGLRHTAPGAWPCPAPPDSTQAVLCPILPCSGGSTPLSVTGVPTGSQHWARASWGGEPGPPELAGQGHPCCWLGSCC